MKRSRRMYALSLVLIFLLIGGGISGCGGKAKTEIKKVPLSQLPPALQQAAYPVREAYQFALANQDVLEKIPCFCGCGNVGHLSNYDCYVQDDGSTSGQLVLDSHAFG